MSDVPISDRLHEVRRLANALCEQVLDAQIMGRPVPEEQARALAAAARLLRDHAAERPPMLEQALHGLARDIGGDADDGGRELAPQDGPALKGLGRLAGVFRRDKPPT